MSLVEKLRILPKEPGVYLMKDGKNTIIYVGKAKNLKSRVTSYFQSKDHTIKTRALVAEIRDFELMLTKNEIEAILLERTLIKHHKPRYNILLRDDKEFPFIRVDFREPWPRLEKVRRRKDDGATYVGPFANPSILWTMLHTVMRIFPLIRCSRHEFANTQRPCNYYHIKMCLAPCTKPVDRNEYIFMVKNAVALLEGKNKKLIHELQQKMKEASRQEKYELAASYRDQVLALQKIGEKQVVVVQDTDDADVIAIYETNEKYSFHVTMVRACVVVGGENFVVNKQIETYEEVLHSFMLQYYDHRLLPSLVILPFSLEDAENLIQAISGEGTPRTKAKIPSNREQRELMMLAEKNARHYLEQKADVQKKGQVALEELQTTLKLDRFPERMECIDISNLQASAIVASNVCFIDGKPAKDFYRLYNIRSVTAAPDDFSSIEEVVRRRLRRAVADGDAPDLLVIDGGKGQLNAALKAKQEFPEVDTTIVSLAKSRTDKKDRDWTQAPMRSHERVFLPGAETALPLREGTPPYRLLVQLRDEAHRFAITFHRKKRSQNLQASLLDQVPGIGPTLRKRLLESFGSINAIQNASIDQLITVKGMKESVAVALKSFLDTEHEPNV